MSFYLLSLGGLILVTWYSIWNKSAIKNFPSSYSFWINISSAIVVLFFAIYDIPNFTFNITNGFLEIIFYIFLLGLIIAVRTKGIEYSLKNVDIGIYELIMKFNIIFMLILEFYLLGYIPTFLVVLGILIFLVGLTISLKFDTTKQIKSNVFMVIIFTSLLFAISPFIEKFIVTKGILPLSLLLFSELAVSTLLIFIFKKDRIEFNKSIVYTFFPLSFIRMAAAYLNGMAVVIGSPTINELIKSSSILLLFIIPLLYEKKVIPLKVFIGAIIGFIGISLTIIFK